MVNLFVCLSMDKRCFSPLDIELFHGSIDFPATTTSIVCDNEPFFFLKNNFVERPVEIND